LFLFHRLAEPYLHLSCCCVCHQTAELLARSTTNKALNDKKRLATSSANVARSR
jgi:hypothetical protein